MDILRKYWHIITGVLCVAVLGAVYLGGRAEPDITVERTVLVSPAEERSAVAEITPEVIADIVVHIEGEVLRPGVYTLPQGSRVNDLLTLAGGSTTEADLARVNLAAFLDDAQQVIIPTIGQEVAHSPQGQAAGGLVNINTADAAALTALPGVGAVTAGNIVSYREANGLFNSVDDLINVPRIGESTMERLRELITVG
jgi:competence protein ComEA